MKKNETMPGVCCLLKNKGPQSITLGIARERGVRGGGSEKRRKEEVPVEDRQEEKKGPEPETEIPLSMRGSGRVALGTTREARDLGGPFPFAINDLAAPPRARRGRLIGEASWSVAASC